MREVVEVTGLDGDLLAASQTLSQLSYTPTEGVPAEPAGLKL